MSGSGSSMWTDELIRLLREDGESFYKVEGYERTDSTNEVCRRAFRRGEGEGFVAAADEQTAGKGRLGRRWESPPGESVYFSFLLTPRFPAERVPGLTLVMGLSTAQAVRELYGLPVGIKWPNDVVVRGRKLCGILTEAVTETGSLSCVIVGTGLNVNNAAFDGELADRATSVRIETGRDADRAALTARILEIFRRNYGIYSETADMTGLMAAYDSLLVSRDCQVRIEDPAGAYTAVSRGITPDGALAVELPDGSTRRIASGEVSVRGLYGYV